MNGPHLHCCLVPECKVVIRDDQQMCWDHWRRLPYETRADVARAHRLYGAGELSFTELCEINSAAIEAVLARTGPTKGGTAA